MIVAVHYNDDTKNVICCYDVLIFAWQPNLVQKVVGSQAWSPNTPLKHLIVNLSATLPPKKHFL